MRFKLFILENEVDVLNIKEESEFEKEPLLDHQEIQDEPEYDSNIELHDEPLDDTLFEPQGAPSYAPPDEPLNELFVEQEKNSRTTKKYSCPSCKYSTNKPQYLEHHNKNFHTGIFTCNICEEEMKKSGKIPWCPKRWVFKTVSGLESHNLQYHSFIQAENEKSSV